METVTVVVWLFFILVAVLIWIFAIPISTWIVGMKILFFSPKKGSVVAKTKNNRVIGYYGNTYDEEKFVVEGTGKIKSIYLLDENQKPTTEYEPEYVRQLEELENSILWQWLGVRWLGMNSLFTYQFSENITAESIYLKNVFELEIPNLLTKEQTEVTLLVSFSLLTTDAGKSLNYKDGLWKKYVEDAIKSTCREFVGDTSYEDISPEAVEHSISEQAPLAPKDETKGQEEKNLGLLKRIMVLNKTGVGNIGLPDEVGQMIVSFRLKQVKIKSELVTAGEAPKIAKKNAEAANEKAIGEAKAIKEKAAAEVIAITTTGAAKNAVLREKTGIAGQEKAANMEIAEVLANAILHTKMQAISFGSEGIPFILSGVEKPPKENEGAESKKKKREK